MQISETPEKIAGLNLLIRLKEYADKKATWKEAGAKVGERESKECLTLYANIIKLVESTLYPLLGKINAREMETFTLHDKTHGLKVAHLMWHILEPERRELLTPPEIAILIYSAFIHDIGMAVSPEEREARLDPDSDLWERLEFDEGLKDRIEALRKEGENTDLHESERQRARQKLAQAEEALLCQDTRERHDSKERYEQIIAQLQEFHKTDPENIPDIKSCLSFDGYSFFEKLVDICVSHGQDAAVLPERDKINIERPRFQRDYPVGCCVADLHLICAALRIADILDFDRERTPALLFHYLLPGPLTDEDDRSKIEWAKHLTITNWTIEERSIVFRGRCNNHIIHHAVANFCSLISHEISATKDTFGESTASDWPFSIPTVAIADIQEDGYHYVPYKFELDDERVYKLLMGGSIYKNPLMAVRELVQNAVDACKYRDSMTQLYDDSVAPQKENRIIIKYEEPNGSCKYPKLIVQDSGSGMDKTIIEHYFLKVGKSYYDSVEFNRHRIELRKSGFDFAPVSEFGIGFLSCFLLADRIMVGTAMSEPIRGDTRKRTLIVDGPTRLIRLNEEVNDGPNRFRGTTIVLFLIRGNPEGKYKSAPTWEQINEYIKDICQDLPYRLSLVHKSKQGVESTSLNPVPLKIDLPPEIEKIALRIPVQNTEVGMEGEIVLSDIYQLRNLERERARTSAIEIVDGELDQFTHAPYHSPLPSHSVLLRGGFSIGLPPGLPHTFVTRDASQARIRLTWTERDNRRFMIPNLSRDTVADDSILHECILKEWLTYVIDNMDAIADGFFYHLELRGFNLLSYSWLEEYSAYTLYRLAQKGWHLFLRELKNFDSSKIVAWENAEGDSLRLLWYRHELPWSILDIILPRVSRLQMGPEARFYVKPPVNGWREILSNSKDFISVPYKWGSFVEYIEDIEDLLLYEYAGSFYFNSRYEERLSDLNEPELRQLRSTLAKLSRTDGQRQAMISQSEMSIFNRTLDKIGDLKIGSIGGSWPINSFPLPSID